MADTARWPRPALGDILPALARLLQRPDRLLVLFSALFGTVMVGLNPPLRGPDEPAHFVRIYGYVHGIVLPRTEVDGRKGLYLPGALYEDFAFFDAQRGKVWTPGFSFHTVLAEYRARQAGAAAGPPRAPVFVPFEGSEGYTPIAYAPYVVTGLLLRPFALDFATLLLLMRLAGLLAFTALCAWAVALAPRLKWAFFLTAMLPASLYGRTVLSADGAVVGATLLVLALSLRAVIQPAARDLGQRCLWMTVCVLAKPPQLAFVLLEPMIHPLRALGRRWREIALVAVPGLVLSPLWILAVGAEMADWRLHGDGAWRAEHFTIGWKLHFMAENPLHFPRVMATLLVNEAFGLWRQVIGVLGWLDTHFSLWVYIVLSVLFLAVAFDRLELDRTTRLRLAAYAALTGGAYTVAVFLILFITWTPPSEPVVWGVQGRYFVHLLPLAALLASALCNRRPPLPIAPAAALAGALLSGAAAIEGLWRVNWA